MLKLFLLTCILSIVVEGGNRNRRQSSTTAVANVSTPATVHGSASVEHDSKTGGGSREAWFGKELTIEDVQGCKWPYDFEERFNFCANRTSIGSIFSIAGAEFGLMDKDIVVQLLDKCSTGDCSNVKINRTHLVDRAELWWQHMDNITDFSKCLKKNTEGMVRLCGTNDQVSQTVSGIAGLHLNMIDVLTSMHEHVKEKENRTEACLAKLSEAVHFTAAAYLQSRFYSRNQVLCWDVLKGACNSTCEPFAYILTCLQSACEVQPSYLKKFGIWEWFYTDMERSKRACKVQVDSAQCQSASAIPSKASSEPAATGFLGQSQQYLEKAKAKFQEFMHGVETKTHMKFYQVALIGAGSLLLFIGVVTTLCMWYHGLLCQRRRRRVLRYAKLVPDDRMGQKNEESKSLTRDYDDVE